MKKDRNAGLELLRIIAMFVIVLGHFLSHSNGFTNAVSIKNPLVIAEKAIDSLGLFKVNVFILITGFFMIEKKIDFLKLKNRLFPLWREVFGYSVVIMIIMTILYKPSIVEIIKSCLPIVCYRYWFITTYFVLILLIPIINRAFDKLSEKEYRISMIVLLSCFCIWQTIMPFVTTVDNEKGYSIIWFVVVYIVGGYMKKFGIRLVKNYCRIIIYIGMAVLYFVYSNAFEIIGSKLNMEMNIPFNNSIFALISAIVLFNIFYSINITGKIGRFVSFISGSVFAIYLISDNPYIRNILYTNILKIDKHINNGWHSIAYVLLMSAIVFVVCLLIDLARRTIVSIITKNKR